MLNRENITVDVVIPAYRPGDQFEELLRMLAVQDVPVGKVIVVNTEQEFWDGDRFSGFDFLEVHHIHKSGFDHGATRNMGAGFSEADVIVFMTDDAVPADTRLIGKLTEPLIKYREDENPAVIAYARQIARGGDPIEQFSRRFNYPPRSRLKSKKDLPKLGVKAFFVSNACCAYDRRLFQKRGGFEEGVIFNEDSIYAGRALMDGYSIAYAAGALVYHAHHYSCLQQFHRNFDLAVSQADHPEIFEKIPSEGEGIRLIRETAAWLIKSGRRRLLPKLMLVSACKYAGYFLGKRYRSLPRRLRVWCSMNREYWKRGDKRG